jgi:hypothetical protein
MMTLVHEWTRLITETNVAPANLKESADQQRRSKAVRKIEHEVREIFDANGWEWDAGVELPDGSVVAFEPAVDASGHASGLKMRRFTEVRRTLHPRPD